MCTQLRIGESKYRERKLDDLLGYFYAYIKHQYPYPHNKQVKKS